MTPGDAVALLILAVCIFCGAMNWLKWLWRVLAGVILGVLVLLSLSYTTSVPTIGEAGRFLKDGMITRSLTYASDQILGLEDVPANEAVDPAAGPADEAPQTPAASPPVGDLAPNPAAEPAESNWPADGSADETPLDGRIARAIR